MSSLVERWHRLSQALIDLCDAPVDHDILYLSQQFPKLSAMAPSPLLLPLQNSMTVILPSNRAESGVYRPFPSSAPTLAGAVIFLRGAPLIAKHQPNRFC